MVNIQLVKVNKYWIEKVVLRGNFLSLRDASNDIDIGFWFAVHAVDSQKSERVKCLL